MISTDVLVIGSGAAGLLTALRCATQGLSVVLATKGTMEQSNTAWAQGGVAAALDLEEDSPAAHLADTLAAGAGLCNEAAARVVAEEAPQRVEELRNLGVAFNLEAGGALELTREAAHSRARVAHAADATGRAIATTLAAKVLAQPNVTVIERATAVELTTDGEACLGAWLVIDGRLVPVHGGATVLATGGCGQIYSRTTNPKGATGDGLDLAFEAGAALADLEFVQFHPTALAVAGAPALLVSEAARGEGGTLVDPAGRRFCFDADPRGELAPRDIVARAIFRQLRDGKVGVLLDLRPIGSPEGIRARFPNIAAACARFGIDIGTMPIPVAPAAHYQMGGVVTDIWGRTTVANLYAVGECACTGLHGANRLASNSLAECLVFASRAAEDIAQQAPRVPHFVTASDSTPPALIEAPTRPGAIAASMWRFAGIERSGAELKDLAAGLGLWRTTRRPVGRVALESRSLLRAAQLIAGAALAREESRGSHWRADFPNTDDASWRARIVWDRHGWTIQPLACVTLP